ncbi:MAG: hypothetical protein IMZ62_12835 [Chloroflexi bacterium]|nr:hypothetical protein [Chloroflexota bacterium]MBE3119737.1 hypothetical protein [Candidatus Atribacteria bacterium]
MRNILHGSPAVEGMYQRRYDECLASLDENEKGLPAGEPGGELFAGIKGEPE